MPPLGSVGPLLLLLQSDSLLYKAVQCRGTVAASQLGGRAALIRVIEDDGEGRDHSILIKHGVRLTGRFELFADALHFLVYTLLSYPLIDRFCTHLLL